MLDLKNINYDQLKEKMVYQIQNYNIDYDEQEKDDMYIDNYYKAEIEKNFRLPITYLSDKYEIQENIKTDLELCNKNNLYKYVCNPNTKIAEFTTEYWNKYYTCNTMFLKDSIELLENYKFLPNNLFITNSDKSSIRNKDIVDEVFDKWTEIKSDTGFADKYGYINWKHFA